MQCDRTPLRAPRLAALDDEEGRILALERYAIVNSGPEPQFDKIAALVRDVFDVPIATITLIDRDRQWIKAASGIEPGAGDRKDAFCDYTIRSRDVLLVEDATRDARFQDNVHVTGDPHIRSYAGVPLVTPDGYNLGSVCAIDCVPRSFSEAQLGMLRRFAGLVVDEIELRSAAQRDFLTGALSRRAMIDQIGLVAARRGPNRGDATLVAFDVDHFKRVNDDHGHPTGDRVLRSVVARARACLRPADVIGRLGGEEFAILLPDTAISEAMACAERLRSAIGAPGDENCPTISASFGVAGLGLGQSVEEWMGDADAALYVAKRQGRNRCVRWDKLGNNSIAA